MSDADLRKIRQARLAQLQRQSGTDGESSSDTQDEQRKQQEDEARASVLAQILTPDAADRLGRIRLVKASRAELVEDRLILLAKGGQLRNKVTEGQLKELLSSLADNTRAQEHEEIVISRRKGGWEDNDDDLEILGAQ